MKKHTASLLLALLVALVIACRTSADPTSTSIPSPFETIRVTETQVKTPTPRPPRPTKNPYMELYKASPSAIFFDHTVDRGTGRGVKVFLGENKAFVFEIVGGANCSSMPSGQGYLVRYEDGTHEWKDRVEIEQQNTYVLNDANLYFHDWTLYDSCS